MNFFARKISRAKWDKPDFASDTNAISADAITADLRTSYNTLSFWKCDKNEKDLQEIVIALASTQQKLERIDIVVIPRIFFEVLTIEQTEGITPVVDLKNRHIDVSNLTLNELTQIAQQIAVEIRLNSNYKRFPRGEVGEILLSAVNNKRLNLDSLDEERQKDLIEELNKLLNDQKVH